MSANLMSAGSHARSVLLVDDSPAIRRALRFCIERSHDLEVCGEAENGKSALDKVADLHPDVVILDFRMPGMDGLQTARQIRRLYPQATIVMFTLNCSDQLLKEAKSAGIKEVFSKSDSTSRMLDAVK